MAKSDGGASYDPDEIVYYEVDGKIGTCRMEDLPKCNPSYANSDMASNWAPHESMKHIRDYARDDSAIAQAKLKNSYGTVSERKTTLFDNPQSKITIFRIFLLCLLIAFVTCMVIWFVPMLGQIEAQAAPSEMSAVVEYATEEPAQVEEVISLPEPTAQPTIDPALIELRRAEIESANAQASADLAAAELLKAQAAADNAEAERIQAQAVADTAAADRAKAEADAKAREIDKQIWADAAAAEIERQNMEARADAKYAETMNYVYLAATVGGLLVVCALAFWLVQLGLKAARPDVAQHDEILNTISHVDIRTAPIDEPAEESPVPGVELWKVKALAEGTVIADMTDGKRMAKKTLSESNWTGADNPFVKGGDFSTLRAWLLQHKYITARGQTPEQGYAWTDDGLQWLEMFS